MSDRLEEIRARLEAAIAFGNEMVARAETSERALAEARARVEELELAATHALGLIVEFANLNGFRNMSDAELGRAVLGVVKELNEVTGGPEWNEERIAEMVALNPSPSESGT